MVFSYINHHHYGVENLISKILVYMLRISANTFAAADITLEFSCIGTKISDSKIILFPK